MTAPSAAPAVITAGELTAGMFLHRVSRLPLSAVFEDAIDLRVTGVAYGTGDTVQIALDGPYNRRLNLAPGRVVTVYPWLAEVSA